MKSSQRSHSNLAVTMRSSRTHKLRAWQSLISLSLSLSLSAGHPYPTCDIPFPPRRSGEYRKGMIPARPLYQGGCGSVWDPEPSKERVGDWGGPATVWSLLCVTETRATRPNGEWGIVLAANAGPRVPSGSVTLKRCCTYRPSVIYLIVNKLLSLSLSHEATARRQRRRKQLIGYPEGTVSVSG